MKKSNGLKKVNDPRVWFGGRIPESLKQRIRLESVRRGTSIGEVLIAVLDDGVPRFDLQVAKRRHPHDPRDADADPDNR